MTRFVSVNEVGLQTDTLKGSSMPADQRAPRSEAKRAGDSGAAARPSRPRTAHGTLDRNQPERLHQDIAHHASSDAIKCELMDHMEKR